MEFYKHRLIQNIKKVSAKTVFFVFTFFLMQRTFTQPYKPARTYMEDSKYNTDSMKTYIGRKIKIPEEYKNQFLIAISYYPELKDKKIEFKYRKIKTTMNCRPSLTSVFRKQRKYNICINNKKDFKGINLKDVPFNAQIGIIGHELAHIKDYENKSSFGIIDTGIQYLIKNKKKKYEQSIDKLTIDKGLGWQLYDWANYSMFDSDKASEKYKKFKRKTYLQPQLIEEEINKQN